MCACNISIATLRLPPISKFKPRNSLLRINCLSKVTKNKTAKRIKPTMGREADLTEPLYFRLYSQNINLAYGKQNISISVEI